ncbi:MAG: (2Fe-2S)-binding protein [Sarcina sp.]
MGLFTRDKNIVCRCKKVSKDQIIEAIKNGASTYEMVKDATGAGAGLCRGRKCKSIIEELIAENN